MLSDEEAGGIRCVSCQRLVVLRARLFIGDGINHAADIGICQNRKLIAAWALVNRGRNGIDRS